MSFFDTNFLSKISIILISTIFYFCENSILNLSINEFLIPNTFLLASDSNLNYNSKGELYFNSNPFSGFLVKKNMYDEVIEKKGFFRGQLEGISLGYYDNGNKKYQRFYNKGKKTGKHIGWFESGQKKFEYFFKGGLSEKKHIRWYDNGMVYSEINYLNGKPFGSTKVWRKDGKLRSNFVVRENGRRYGLSGIKRCTKIDTKKEIIEPYTILK